MGPRVAFVAEACRQCRARGGVISSCAKLGQGRSGQAALTIGVIRVYVYSSLYSIWETGGVFYVSAHENKDPRAILGTLSKAAAVTLRQHQGKCPGCRCVIVGILHFQKSPFHSE